jgi:putative ATP-dependent endonuclease of OLD family
VVDAERDIGRQLSYYSRYSLLSQFAHAVHGSLTEDQRQSLEDAYASIKSTFEGVPQYSKFFANFHEVIENSVKGFVHDLKVDFSAYDPNNFAKSMRIVAYEGNEARSFEEFGTGEQQILLMAFAKAYVQTFGSGSLVLMIEEPEAHLHPLAQRWLKEYIYSLCSNGLQVVISTHSADFLDMSNLDGLVRVCKDDRGVTRVVQLTKQALVDFCLKSGVPSEKISERNVLDFFGTRLFPDESKGFFATKVLLVEGATEYYALPEIMRTLGYSLVQSGVEIVMASGKNSIPLYWRIFKAFGIQCACLFDGDGKGKDKKSSKNANNQLQALLGIDVNGLLATLGEDAYITENVAFFKVDFETFMRTEVSSYAQHEEECRKLGIESKPGLARAVCGMLSKEELPAFFKGLWKKVIRPESEKEVSDEEYVF